MNNDLDILYEEIVKRNKEDFDNLVNYYYEKTKEIDDIFANDLLIDLKDHFKNRDQVNLLNLWFYLQKKHKGDINKPLIFDFKDSFIDICDDLTKKANELSTNFRLFYYDSKFMKTLINNVIDVIKNNKMGLTETEIKKQLNLKEEYNADFERAMVRLQENGTITTLEGKKPTIYYFE